MSENGHRSAAAFRRPIERHTLPSGLEVELQRPDVAAIIMANADSGDIPQPLVDQMLTSLNEGKPVAVKLVYEASHLPGLFRFNRLLARAALRWPVVMPDGVEPDYEAGQIAIEDLDTSDQGWITQWVMEAASAASRFPQAQAAGVGPEPSGGTGRAKTKRNTGPR